jgi:N-acyl-D-amino-acid deacylase
LSRYAGDGKPLSLVEAINKMTGLSAHNMGIAGRGTITPGAFADLVLFDPQTISDRATYAEPTLPSAGIERVWVNGIEVYRDGNSTGAAPGQIVRR